MPILNTRGNASARGFGFTSGGPSLILLSASPGPSATISTYSGYIVFKFTSTGTLNVGAGAPGTADVFVIGGGNSGAPGAPGVPNQAQGGAGSMNIASPGFTITANSPVPVVVGSTASSSSFGPLSSSSPTALDAGSPGALGGGAGGDGRENSYETGSPQRYGGGGGGGGSSGPSPGGVGGAGGGGPGGNGAFDRPAKVNGYGQLDIPATPGSAGTANTGGGGGGGGLGTTTLPPSSAGSGGSGGSGVVIARFPTTQFRTS